MAHRLDTLRSRLGEEHLDAVLVTQPNNQFYLSGFTGGEYLDATLLISADQAWVSTDSRYYEDARQRAQGFALFEAGYDRNKALGEFALACKPKIVGFEPSHLTVATLKDWSKIARRVGFKLKPVAHLVEDLRIVKEPEELERIRRAVAVTDDAFAHFVRSLRPGLTEKQGAWIIESYMREHDADKIAFDLIVASGPNGALPHAVPTDRKMERGEPIIVDIGCRMDHYNSDLTRTVCMGEPDGQFQKIYGIVRKAQETALKKTRPGLKGKRADALARNVIEKAGYGGQFGHSLGHGVGLAVHEAPLASRTSKETLLPDMTLTIEPGIYIPGWGGVRIEDLVVLREGGVEDLSRSSKDPQVSV